MKNKNKLLGAGVLTIIITLMISVGTTTASITQQYEQTQLIDDGCPCHQQSSLTAKQASVLTFINGQLQPQLVPQGDTQGNFWFCLLMCGVPYLVAILALSFFAQGYGPATAMVMAGVTATFISCVIMCLGSGGGSGSET